MRPRSVLTIALLLCASVVGAQSRPLTTDQLKRIFASGGDVMGWNEFDIPEFIAAAYGSRAREAVVALLLEPSTPDNYYLQGQALTTAQYRRVGVPIDLILDFASGRRPGLSGVLRHRALTALAFTPDSSLKEFWLGVAQEPVGSFRQAAAAGLSCALGPSALPHLEQLLADTDASVARVAGFYFRELTVNGPGARACRARATRAQAVAYPAELRPDLHERGQQILRAIP